MSNPFFKNTGPHDINHLLILINITNQKFPNEKISDIKDLSSSQNGEISFLIEQKKFQISRFKIYSQKGQFFRLPNNPVSSIDVNRMGITCLAPDWI